MAKNLRQLEKEVKKRYKNLMYANKSIREANHLRREYLCGYKWAIRNFRDMLDERIEELREKYAEALKRINGNALKMKCNEFAVPEIAQELKKMK